MFLNICFFYSRIKKVIVIIKKNELNKIFRCFRVFEKKKKRKPGSAGNHFLLCKAENTHG